MSNSSAWERTGPAPSRSQRGQRDPVAPKCGVRPDRRVRRHGLDGCSGQSGRGGRSSSFQLALLRWLNNRRLLEPIGNIPPAEAAKVLRAWSALQ
ncbi:MAG: hypothetical protein DCF30_14375 [Hyphomicrobiales bacterium]|nr:MAG: hypothetical protein DCF30_14375 [Hyphomicrobiales bacterium]